MVASLGGHGRPDAELDEAILGALFSESTVGLHVLDAQLRLVRFNTAARYVKAFALDEALGRHPRSGVVTSTPETTRRRSSRCWRRACPHWMWRCAAI